jgi:UDP-3-O-[3-hydroxymyristoyl] N-acetylglucosamine deacetylase
VTTGPERTGRQETGPKIVQTSVKSPVRFAGTGLHSGAPVRLTVHPAPAGTGIWFRRTDLAGRDAMVPANWEAVVPAALCTRIENPAGVAVSTIEHLMAALAGCGVTNALVHIDGPEVPILDGSAAPFVRGIMATGLNRLDAAQHALRILDVVEVRDGASVARLSSADVPEIAFEIDFPDAAIGRQDLTLRMANGAFVRELSDCRTFCRQADVDAMRAQGLALGGTLMNAVVVDGDRVLTPGGLRRADEAVRHKMLDAMGDLALAGLPILGRYTGIRAGHAMTNRLLRALFARPDAYDVVEVAPELARRLPGAGLTLSDLPAAAA